MNRVGTTAFSYPFGKCSGHYTETLVRGVPTAMDVFEIVLQNRGLSLHQPKVDLSWTNEGIGGGMCSCTMRPKQELQGEFAKGIIAEFVIKSAQIRRRVFWGDSKTRLRRKHKINIHSQGYLVYTIPVASWYQRFVCLWNGWAHWIMYKSSATILRPDDVPLLKYRIKPPVFVGLLWPMQCFSEAMTRRLAESVTKRGQTSPPSPPQSPPGGSPPVLASAPPLRGGFAVDDEVNRCLGGESRLDH